MLMVFLVFAGICLFVNGITLYYSTVGDEQQAIESKDAAIVNLFTGILGFIVIALIIGDAANKTQDYSPAAYIALFALTYTWSGINAFTGANGRALGWYSLMVAAIALPVGVLTFYRAASAMDYWMGLSWLAWAALWFMSFLILVKQANIARTTGAISAVQGVVTALLPALLNFWGFL